MSKELIEQLAKEHGIAFDTSYSSTIPKGRVEYVFTSIEHLEAFAKAYAQTQLAEQTSAEHFGWFVEVSENRHDVAMVDSEKADHYKKEGKPMRKLYTAPPSVEVLLEALRKITRIAHRGGLLDMSEADALIAIRKATIPYFDTSESEKDARDALNSYRGISHETNKQ